MLTITNNDYEQLFGNIDEKTLTLSETCMSQCTGCMCNCRCSCSYIENDGFDWEVK